MLGNLKSSDWIAAGLRGLSAGATVYFGQGLGGGGGEGGGDTPPPIKAPTLGTVTPNNPIGDMAFLPDNAMPIFENSGLTEIDFGSTVLENLEMGPNAFAQMNTPMNVQRLQFDPTAPMFDITPEVDLNAIIPEPVIGGVVGQVVPENAYQVGDWVGD